MAFDGSGNYVPAAAPNFPAISGNVISATYYNATINELATSGLSLCLTRDGQGKPSGPINWNNQNLTAVATFAATSASLTNALPVTSGGTGLLTVPTNGQILIGNGTNYTLASLTAGANITITPGAGSITIAASSTGVATVSGGTTGLTFTGTTALTLGGTLAVANGGTGVTTGTGTGSNVLSAGPTFTGVPAAPTAAVNTNTTQLATTAFVIGQAYAPLASPPLTGTPTINGNPAGFLDLVGSSPAGAYTLVIGDRGQALIGPGPFTIPANASVAFPVRTVVTFIATAATTVAITTDTLTLHGTATTGTRTVPINGVCTVIKTGAAAWLATGDVT